MDIELRHLRYFLAVAEELHFGRAAERLVISQPALSRQIRELEREIGAELFVRTSRQVALTPAGELLVADARLALAQAERAVDVARRAGRGQLGHLAIGYLGSVACSVLPGLVRAFRASHPDVGLLFYDAIDDKQLAAIEERHLDVGFVRSPGSHGGVRIEPILDEPLCAVLPADHALAGQAALDLGALAEEPFVLWPRALSANVHDEIVAACRRHGFVPRLEVESAGTLGTFGLVAAGIGVSILVESYRALRAPGVAFVPIHGLTSTLYVAWREDNRSATLRAFLAVVRDHLG